MANTIQYSVILFVIISAIICLLHGKSIQKSKRKHLIAAGFLIGAALVHAIVLVMDICYRTKY
tara:strand:+ start:4298 stop:4486 length:189 start_codon:yes stop_codon:yes gene_type:complete